MKRIVIDAREYPSSTGRYIRKFLEYLEKIDANSDREYVVLLKSADFDSFQPKASNFKKVRADFKEFTFSEQIGLLRLIRNLKPALVHFGMVQQPVMFTGNKVTTMHDLTTLRFMNPEKNPTLFKIKQSVYGFVNKRVARSSKAILVPSEFVKQDVANYTRVNPEKIEVTYESADKISVPAEEFAPLKNQQFLMYVGRALPHKNLMNLIDAFSLIKEKHPLLKLVLVGKKDSHIERHLAYAASKNIPDVMATGYVSEGQLRWLYENTACYCFPSLSEGFGLPSLEAMAHGAPVASSNATCLPEVNGDAAIYINPTNIQEMAKAISLVLEDQHLRKELIAKGYEQVKKYSWQRMAQETLQVYLKCLSD